MQYFLAILLILIASSAEAKSTPSPKICPKEPVFELGKVSLENDFYYWSKAKVCIARHIREVWAVANNHPLLKWDGIDHSEVKIFSQSEKPYSQVYDILYWVENFLGNIEWHMRWTYQVTEGAESDPKKLKIQYVKTLGTSFIKRWEGDIELERIDQKTTVILFHDRVRAANTEEKDSLDGVKLFIERLKKGDPNWSALKIADKVKTKSKNK